MVVKNVQGLSDFSVCTDVSWTSKYPEKYRKLLENFGIKDNGHDVLCAYNNELIEIANYSNGKHHIIFDTLLLEQQEDWAGVFGRYNVNLPKRMPNDDPIFASLDYPPIDRFDPFERESESYNTSQILKILRGSSGIGYTESLFKRMQATGHGPFSINAGRHLSRYRQWQSSVFGLDSTLSMAVSSEILERRPVVDGKPNWVLVSDWSPDAIYLSNYLNAWGANVEIVITTLEAAQIVSRRPEISGVIMMIDNIEAEFVIADILMRRAIGFLIVANNGARPLEMALGGMMIQNLSSIDEIRTGLASLPSSQRSGLDLSVQPQKI